MTKRWQPSLWASRKPFGIGEQRPNNYLEIWNAIRENRRNLRYAWRILRDGVCDGCALGTTGLHDWTLDEIHLCNVRLRLLQLNTMPALDPRVLPRPARLLHDEPRPAERELLRGAEGGARARHELDRQRGPRLPRAEHVRAQG